VERIQPIYDKITVRKSKNGKRHVELVLPANSVTVLGFKKA
jgi:hypothetical protein